MSHILISDPQDISSRFDSSHRLGASGESDLEEILNDELSPSAEDDISSVCEESGFKAIEQHLDRIPSREADLITLYYKDNMKQEKIAKIFGITQAAVSYRLHRGIKRVQFLRTIPILNFDEF